MLAVSDSYENVQLCIPVLCYARGVVSVRGSPGAGWSRRAEGRSATNAEAFAAAGRTECKA